MRKLFVAVATFFFSVLAFPQSPTAPSIDANAVVAQAIAAFSSQDLQSIRLEGNASEFAGSDQPSGSFSYSGTASGSGTLQLSLGDLSRTEIFSTLGARDCKWVDAEGKSHDVTPHNCSVSVNTVMPLLGLAHQFASLTTSAAAATDESGNATTRVTLQRPWPDDSPKIRDLLLKLSRADLDLDPQTHLVRTLRYNTHPDRDAGIDIPVEVRYSDYRQVNGASIPFHIQKFLNHGLALDLTVTNATVQ